MEAGAAADYARRHELQARAAEEPCAEAVAKAAQQAERRGRSARGRAELARKVAIVKTMAAGRAAGLVAGPENPAGFGPQLTMAHQPGHAMPLDMPAGGFRNLGTVVGLNDPALGNLLSATNFVANGAAIFSFGSGSGTSQPAQLHSLQRRQRRLRRQQRRGAGDQRLQLRQRLHLPGPDQPGLSRLPSVPRCGGAKQALVAQAGRSLFTARPELVGKQH